MLGSLPLAINSKASLQLFLRFLFSLSLALVLTLGLELFNLGNTLVDVFHHLAQLLAEVLLYHDHFQLLLVVELHEIFEAFVHLLEALVEVVDVDELAFAQGQG